MNSNWSYSPETLNSGQNWQYFVPCDLEIWWMTLENDRAPHLYQFKLCAPFQIHQWSQTWVTVWKRSILVKIGDILSRVNLKFDGWPWKTIGYLLYTTSSFVHHFKAMGELKLELQSGLGRVPDVRVRVQVRVLVICVSTSTSTWLLHESESEYWLMSTSTSTSTGLWSTFYIACIGSRFLLFGLWQESPQILTNLGQSSNCPLSM